jgi:hypothetical protein
MPIIFNCTCGKKLQARDELAGKKLKCPGCHKVLPVPAVNPPLAKPVLASSSPSALPPLSGVPDFPAEDNIASSSAGRPTAAMVNFWVDRSLDQQPTPWQGDDREKLNQGMVYREVPEFLVVFLCLLLLGGLAAAAFFLLPDGKPARTARGTTMRETGVVQGKVTYKGQPLPFGFIYFHPPAGEPFDDLILDGSYRSAGLPPGPCKVTVITKEFKGAPDPKGFPKGFKGPGKGGPPAEYRPPKFVPIPQKYAHPNTSGLALEVKVGKQPFNIDLTD